jgi:hypothetical protein
VRSRATPNGLWPKICHAHDPIDILTMALLFGILILTMPQMGNYLIGIYSGFDRRHGTMAPYLHRRRLGGVIWI